MSSWFRRGHIQAAFIGGGLAILAAIIGREDLKLSSLWGSQAEPPIPALARIAASRQGEGAGKTIRAEPQRSLSAQDKARSGVPVVSAQSGEDRISEDARAADAKFGQIEVFTLTSESTRRLDRFGIALSVSFENLQGVDYATLITTTVGGRVIREPLMSSGRTFRIPTERGVLRLVVTKLDWQRRSVDCVVSKAG